MLHEELYRAITACPLIDVHSHLPRNQLAAENLESVVLYHMLRYPLRAAGVLETDLWPGRDIHAASGNPANAIASHPKIASTSFAWALRTILRDLYDFDEQLSGENVETLRRTFADKTASPSWGRDVLRKAGVVRVMSSQTRVPPLEEGQADPGIRFTIERGATPHAFEYRPWKDFLDGFEKQCNVSVRTMHDFREGCRKFYDAFDWSDKHGLVSWISSIADFTPTHDTLLNESMAAVRAGRDLPPADEALLRAGMVRAMLTAAAEHTRVFQLVYGMEFQASGMPHPVAKVHPSFAPTLSYLVADFPQLQFDLLNGYENDEPTLCSLALAHDNVSMSSFWWHTFYPSVMKACWHRRLDMVPVSKLCGFFSDGYCVDWIYARVRMTQRVLAIVLAEKVEQGFYSESQAMDVARALLFETPKSLFLADEAIDVETA